MRRFLCASFVMLLLGALAAGQQPPVDPSAAALQSGVENARQQMDSDPAAAVATLDRLASESAARRSRGPLTEAERAVHRDLFLLRARAYLQLLSNDKVEESFRELLRVEPFFSGRLAPREQGILDAIRKREGGSVEVSSRELGANILVDGAPAGVIGVTPTRLTLVAGDYQVRLEKEGYQPAETKITVVAQQTLTLDSLIPMLRVPPVAFLTDRDGIEVLVDNKSIGRTVKLTELRDKLAPAEGKALDDAITSARFDPSATGVFLLRDAPLDRQVPIRFHRDCFTDESRNVNVTTEAMTRITSADAILWLGDTNAVKMQPDQGTLRVTSVPSEADVFMDGQLAGRTPFEREVCSGSHKVRVRHRIGSYTATVTVARGRTELFEATLKPGLALVGAVEVNGSSLRPDNDLLATLNSALSSSVRTYRLADMVDLPTEVQRWTPAAAADLVAASDKNDSVEVSRLLRLANDSFDAPVVVVGVRRGGDASAARSTELLVFWTAHTNVDHLALPATTAELGSALARFDEPADGTDLVYQNDVGIRVADTALPKAPLLIVQVAEASPASAADLKVGDNIESVNNAPVTARQFLELLGKARPADVIGLTVGRAGTPSRQVQVSVRRQPRRALVFNDALIGNAIVAKLTAAGLLATAGTERDLLNFNLAQAYMRFGSWRAALDMLSSLGNLNVGSGVGPGAALFYRALCHERLGERDAAIGLYRQAAAIDNQPLADDGASVGAVAKRRLIALGDTATPPQ